jgi:ABC-type antimicrobial peptide transport system permease subunit
MNDAPSTLMTTAVPGELVMPSNTVIREKAGIEKQIHLPFSKAFEISLGSIRNRFWRTLITAIGILLGVAFLTSVISSGSFARAAAWCTEVVARQHGVHSARWINYQSSIQETQVRQLWLVSLALLVSTLGITNSMLMSVAERYREIGTMKCLGALDSFVVRLFIIEASMTGLIASTLGSLLGFVLMLLAYLGQEGTAFVPYVQFPYLIKWVLFSIVGGSLLSLLASAWPAAIAARMPPAAAFRVDI